MDKIPKSLSLPEDYPFSWIYVHDFNYPTALIGKYVVVDVAAEKHQFKGQFQGAQLSAFAESPKRNELYVAETVFSRGSFGERTDVLSIYEKQNLMPIAEVVLPGGKRALMSPYQGLTRMTRDEKFVLVYNFTPSASVTVVDMDKREVVSEVPLPGCSLIYPSGPRGFSTLCGNGTMVSIALGEAGQVTEETVTEAFNDIKNDALYMIPASIGDRIYYVSTQGNLQPVNVGQVQAVVEPAWSLLSKKERADRWLTTQGQTAVADDAGLLYLRMHKVDDIGQHLPGSSEIWVFDVNKQKRMRRIELEVNGQLIDGTTIAVTKGENPYLVLLGEDGLYVFSASNGEYIRHIGGWWPGANTVKLIHPSQANPVATKGQ